MPTSPRVFTCTVVVTSISWAQCRTWEALPRKSPARGRALTSKAQALPGRRHSRYATRKLRGQACPHVSRAWPRLSLFALEAHDLALSKLERISSATATTCSSLHARAKLNPEILKQRYYSELRPNLLAHEARHD